MKAYVVYYGPESEPSEEETPEQKDARLARPITVQFHKDPLWTLPAKEMADIELGILRRQGVHVNHHFCEFEVEELPEGKFAIVCTNYPDHQQDKIHYP